MVMAWPARIKDAGGIRNQFHHVIDIVPTILEAAGLQVPVSVNGIAQKPLEGVSMVYTWDNAGAEGRRTSQYFEMFGARAMYQSGWIASAPPTLTRFISVKPNYTPGRTLYTYSGQLANVPFPGTAGAPSLLDRSYRITAEVDIPQSGAEGMLVTDGGRSASRERQ
jgi:arylsulfatase A-like enzyme